MSIGNRIKARRKALGLTQTDIGKALGISRAAVSLWESGESKTLRQDHLLAVARILRVSPDWLVYGTEKPPAAKQKVSYSIPEGAGVALWETPGDIEQPDAYVAIEHFDVGLSAGPGSEAEWVVHKNGQPLMFRANFFAAMQIKPQACKALYVRGTSMEPTLSDRDTVLIDTTQTDIEDDHIYALLYQGDLFVKRLFKLPGNVVEVRSDNARHSTVHITGVDLDQLKILGKVVYRSGRI